MKTFILASLLALTAVSGVVVASQSAAAGGLAKLKPICQCVGYPRPNPAGN